MSYRWFTGQLHLFCWTASFTRLELISGLNYVLIGHLCIESYMILGTETSQTDGFCFFSKWKGRMGRVGFTGLPGPLVRPCSLVMMADFSQDYYSYCYCYSYYCYYSYIHTLLVFIGANGKIRRPRTWRRAWYQGSCVHQTNHHCR